MNPTALITGASRGIGRGIAVELAALGWDLIVNYASNHAAAEEARKECESAAARAGKSIRVLPSRADISSAPDRETLLKFAKEHFGKLDMLVNNAGVAPNVRADLLDVSEESLDRLLAINVKGPFFLTQAVARWMLQTPTAAGPRAIVTVSSISADTASINRGDYCVSKAALSMLTPLFAARLAGDHINTYEIRPGIIATDMTAGVRGKYDELIANGLTPIQRWGAPSDVGKAVAAIAQGLLPFSTGEVINVDGGFHIRRL
jgi:NAD(P)-dependent dehydrogenase (short-subunit alcohol dehydrogenase family)